MAVPGMAQKLNTQMNLEFHASNVYLNLSEWCARHRFDGAATFLRTRAQSSITLTMRVFDYLKKAGSWPIVNPDHACNPECTSLEDLFTQTLSDYQQRSRLLSGLAQEANAQSDDSTCGFSRCWRKSSSRMACYCKACLRKFVMPIKPVSGWSRPIGV